MHGPDGAGRPETCAPVGAGRGRRQPAVNRIARLGPARNRAGWIDAGGISALLNVQIRSEVELAADEACDLAMVASGVGPAAEPAALPSARQRTIRRLRGGLGVVLTIFRIVPRV